MNKPLSPFRSVLLTGASGSLGEALARILASPGVTLALGGRQGDRLEATAAHCRQLGATVTTACIDVTDAAAMADWVRAADAHEPLDLVITCAGISGERGLPGDDPELAAQIYRTNVLGVLHTVEPVLPAMRQRRRGQIGLIASAAGFRGMARGPAYSGSKAALIVHGQSWREALAPFGIGVTVACPGYIHTPMTARHDFSLPFALTPEQAARRIVAALAANRGRVVFPWQIAVAGWLFRALPAALTGLLIPGPHPAEREHP